MENFVNLNGEAEQIRKYTCSWKIQILIAISVRFRNNNTCIFFWIFKFLIYRVQLKLKLISVTWPKLPSVDQLVGFPMWLGINQFLAYWKLLFLFSIHVLRVVPLARINHYTCRKNNKNIMIHNFYDYWNTMVGVC